MEEGFTEIEIPTTVRVMARIVGGLAEHPSISKDGGQWTITHLASMAAVSNELDTWSTASRVMDALHALDIDWTQDAPTIKAYASEQGIDVKQIITDAVATAIRQPKKVKKQPPLSE